MKAPSSPPPPAPRRRRSRTAHWRRSAVVTVAAGSAALLGSGCADEIIGNPLPLDAGFDGTTYNPPPPDAGGDAARDAGTGDGEAELRCGVDLVCNPPPTDWDAGPADACPSPDAVSGPCANEGQRCDTGRSTGCNEPLIAECWQGEWQEMHVSCNPPAPVWDAGLGDAAPPDSGSDGGDASVAVDCPKDTPDPGEPCEGKGACDYGGCVLDWNAEATCAEGEWRVRLQNCWTGEWFTLERAEPDGGTEIDE